MKSMKENIEYIQNNSADRLKEMLNEKENVKMSSNLDYNEVFKFMRDFRIDYINRFNELIIDEPTNTYVSIEKCKDIKEVETYVMFALCRPISKGLNDKASSRLLQRVNRYFGTELTKDDLLLMYQELCYTHKLQDFNDFIERGFPMEELKKSIEIKQQKIKQIADSLEEN